MWTRAELKAKGKMSLKANYWRTVLVAIVLSVVLGSFGAASGGAGGASGASMATNTLSSGQNVSVTTQTDVNDDQDPQSMSLSLDDGTSLTLGENGDVTFVGTEGTETYHLNEDEMAEMTVGFLAVAAAFIGIIVAVVMIVAALIDAFILNPMEVGSQRFFLVNLNNQAEVKEVPFAFDHNYKNVVKVMFFRDLYLILWTMLLIVPGIIKSYEYRMIPYLLAENPGMDRKTAFAETKRMMRGNKWRAFVLDLSFIGWDLLSAFTCGLLGLFYVTPYKYGTSAALYERLRYEGGAPALNVGDGPVAPAAHFASTN